MWSPTRCPECSSPLGYQAGVCDTCHAHHVDCAGPGGRHQRAHKEEVNARE
jgi:hypothetical protein